MAAYLATVKLPFKTGLPRDVSENTFWFSDEADDPGDVATDIFAFLGVFYNEVHTTRSIATLLTEFIVRDNVNVDIHHVNTGDNMPWIYIPVISAEHLEISDAIADSISLPLEVALCMTYGGADPAPGTLDSVPARRRRGRVYVGPWQAEITEDADDDPHPTTLLLNTVANAGKSALNSQSAFATGSRWVVQSRVDPGTVPDPGPPYHVQTVVQGGYVDDEWDTQRRRGVAATARTPWSPSLPA